MRVILAVFGTAISGLKRCEVEKKCHLYQKKI